MHILHKLALLKTGILWRTPHRDPSLTHAVQHITKAPERFSHTFCPFWYLRICMGSPFSGGRCVHSATRASISAITASSPRLRCVFWAQKHGKYIVLWHLHHPRRAYVVCACGQAQKVWYGMSMVWMVCRYAAHKASTRPYMMGMLMTNATAMSDVKQQVHPRVS